MIPPQQLENKKLIKIFYKTKIIQITILKEIQHTCTNLSMGMSKDYEIAINEGATHIRIGTGLFGNKKY